MSRDQRKRLAALFRAHATPECDEDHPRLELVGILPREPQRDLRRGRVRLQRHLSHRDTVPTPNKRDQGDRKNAERPCVHISKLTTAAGTVKEQLRRVCST
jgi:hypothetical protein